MTVNMQKTLVRATGFLIMIITMLLLAILMGRSGEASGETSTDDVVGGGEDFLSGVEDFLDDLGPMGIAGLILMIIVVLVFVFAILNLKHIYWNDRPFLSVPIGILAALAIIAWFMKFIQARFGFFNSFVAVTLVLTMIWILSYKKANDLKPELESLSKYYLKFNSLQFLGRITGPLFIACIISIMLEYKYGDWNLFDAYEHGFHVISLCGVVIMLGMFVSVVFYFYLTAPKQMLKINYKKRIPLLKWKVQLFPTGLFWLIGLTSIVYYIYALMKGFGIAKGGNTAEEIYYYLDYIFGGEVSIPMTDFKLYTGYVFFMILSVLIVNMAYELTFRFHMWKKGVSNILTYTFVILNSFSIVFVFDYLLSDLELNLLGCTITVAIVVTFVKIVGWVWGIGLASATHRKTIRYAWLRKLVEAIDGEKITSEKKIVAIWGEVLEIGGSSELANRAVHEHELRDLWGEDAVAHLIEVLEDDDTEMRIQAANALGILCDKRAVEPLVIALLDKKAGVRKAVVDALGALEDERAVEPLIAALKDDIAGVRKAAVKALWSIGNEKAIPHLQELVHDRFTGEIAREAVECLSRKITGTEYSIRQRELAEELDMPVEYRSPSGIDFVLVPAGTFTMGSAKISNATPHQVTITKPFYMGKYQVTQVQWKAIMENNPSFFKGNNRPVEQISWEDCQEFINKLNETEETDRYRMPTEAEWEYSCRAGSDTKFCFGDNEDMLHRYTWFLENSGEKTWVVGMKRPNVWGLYGMHGNVCEWCHDRYRIDYYKNSPETDPPGPSAGSCRVFRSGSFSNVHAGACASASGGHLSPDARFNAIGFRLVRSIESGRHLRIDKDPGDTKETSTELNHVGSIYTPQGKPEPTIQNYVKELRIAEESGDKQSVYILLNNIGEIYRLRGDHDRALLNYKKALIIIEELGEKSEIAPILNNIGAVFITMGEYETALKYFKTSLLIQNSLGIPAKNTELWIENTKNERMIAEKISSGNSVENAIGMLVEAGMAEDAAIKIVNAVLSKLK